MKYINILSELWTKPTLITPQMHRQLCEIVDLHLRGEIRELSKEEKRVQADITFVENIAVIPIYGIIARGVSKVEGSSGISSVYNVSKMIELALENENVEGILYDIDSPGGSVTGTPELAAKILEAAKEKPSGTYVESLAASAGYWLASQTDFIYAAKSAHVGSIGVYMAWLDESRKLEMEGLKVELIKRGKFKGMGIPGTALTEEQRDHLQAGVDKVFGWFVDAVKTKRPDIPAAAMEGQTFYSDEALENDLIDAIGDREAAIAELKDLIEQK